MPAALDLIGHQFGRLTVVARVAAHPAVKWKCQCECGKAVEVPTGSLRTGNTTSCGCLRVERHAEATAHDLVGRVFGRLTVLRKDRAPHDRPHWICRCECGGEKAVMGKHMLGGMIRSCGCIRRERTALTGAERAIDRTGLRYGRLLVKSRAPNVGRVSYWNCLCDCGGQKVVAGNNLQGGSVKSCGCALQREASEGAVLTPASSFVPRAPVEDMTGQRFGMLVVLRRGATREGRPTWLCECDCGNTAEIAGRSLRSGNNRSCGCMRRKQIGFSAQSSERSKPRAAPYTLIDMTGQRCGKLVVLSKVDEVRQNCGLRWHCLCDCGNATIVRGVRLRTGETVSCGCIMLTGEVLRPKQIRQIQAQKLKQKYRIDIRFALDRKMQTRMRTCLRQRKVNRVERWEGITGYTIAQLEARLLETMPSGYSWGNFLSGELEIDHIRELWRFNFTSENDPEFREAWALTNLQLLTKRDHIAKRPGNLPSRKGKRRPKE